METNVNEKKYPTWKKVGLVVAGASVAVGVGYLANKFGFLPKSLTNKTIETAIKPIVNNGQKAVKVAGKVAEKVTNIMR